MTKVSTSQENGLVCTQTLCEGYQKMAKVVTCGGGAWLIYTQTLCKVIIRWHVATNGERGWSAQKPFANVIRRWQKSLLVGRGAWSAPKPFANVIRRWQKSLLVGRGAWSAPKPFAKVIIRWHVATNGERGWSTPKPYAKTKVATSGERGLIDLCPNCLQRLLEDNKRCR